MEKTKALLGAGCFWGIEEFFRKISGILDTKVGYSGGNSINPTYEDVCTNQTGHAEVVQIEFDLNEISYDKIIEYFWLCHDSTQFNKQGSDIGTQYRSVIYFFSDEQKNEAEKSKVELQKSTNKELATTIEEVKEFYLAEEYHQCFLQKRT